MDSATVPTGRSNFRGLRATRFSSPCIPCRPSRPLRRRHSRRAAPNPDRGRGQSLGRGLVAGRRPPDNDRRLSTAPCGVHGRGPSTARPSAGHGPLIRPSFTGCGSTHGGEPRLSGLTGAGGWRCRWRRPRRCCCGGTRAPNKAVRGGTRQDHMVDLDAITPSAPNTSASLSNGSRSWVAGMMPTGAARRASTTPTTSYGCGSISTVAMRSRRLGG